MNGIFYARFGQTGNDDPEVWHRPQEKEEIIVSRDDFQKFFPDVKIQGKIAWRCDNAREKDACEGNCQTCGKFVKLVFNKDGSFTAIHTNEPWTHRLNQFSWNWSGSGTTEHWFDEKSVCLKTVSSYISESGRTADSNCIVAYNRHCIVESFRKGEVPAIPKEGVIAAEFADWYAKYRSNWTGFAISQSSIGDLDKIIKIELGEMEPPRSITCKHNASVQMTVVSEKEKIPFFLCKACRIKGISWAEFTFRNRRDLCPYMRRACKAFAEGSDKLPRWFYWGDNLLSAQCRLETDNIFVFEVTFVRKAELFIRRAVLVLNDSARSAQIFPYKGFIPNKLGEFQKKYPPDEGRYFKDFSI